MSIITPDRVAQAIHWPSVIRHYRLSKGLKQAALAHDLNVTQTMVSRWEAAAAEPSRRIQDKLFDLFWATSSPASREAWLERIRRHPSIIIVFDNRGRQVEVSRGVLRSLGVERSEIEGRYMHECYKGDFVHLFDALTASGFFEGRVASAESVDWIEYQGGDRSVRSIHAHGLHRPVFMQHQTIYWLASGAEVSQSVAHEVRARLGGKMVIRKAI
jgi:PAS domain S-box-containing protein